MSGPTGDDERLADRPLSVPAPWRLPLDTAHRSDILAAHDRACSAGSPGYADPTSGLFVLTAQFLAARGHCCGNGCRHCPYTTDSAR